MTDQVLTAAAPQASEARYRTLFEYAQVGILLADADSVYIDANPSACRMLGYTRDELIGLHASDIVAGSEVGHIGVALSEIRGDADHHREWQFRRKDGSLFPAEVIATRMPDGTLLGMLRDTSDRKRADAYREHLAAIVESSRDAIIGKDLSGLVTSWNAGAEAIFGYAAAEMMGTSIERLIPEDRREEGSSILAKVRSGERVDTFETLRRARDGRLIDVSIAVSPIHGAGGRTVGASKVARDITALKQREREIARLSRLYAALGQVNRAIVWTPTRDALFEEVCRVLVEDGGFSLAWIGWHDPETGRLVPVGKWGDEAAYLEKARVHADDRPEGRGPSGTAFRSGRPCIGDDAVKDSPERPWHREAAFPIRLNGGVRGTLSVYADKAERFCEKEIALLEEAAANLSFALDNFARDEARRGAEQRVRSEKLFSDTMIESMPGVLYFYDSRGRFLRWNQNFEKVSGYSAEEIAGMHPLDFFSGGDRARVEQRIAEVFETGEASIEATFVAKSGRATPFLFTGTRITLEGLTCLVGVGIDISKRKRAEMELRELNLTLEGRVAERTMALQAAITRAEGADHIKSAFLASMSHELRTPLNAIIGFTGTLLQDLAGPLNGEQRKQLEIVRASGRHLLALVNDVLDISKIEAGQLEVARQPFDVRVSIERVVGVVRTLAERKGLILRCGIAPELGAAIGDERRFEQVLLNLLSNAIKFTERGEVALAAAWIPDFRLPGDSFRQEGVRVQVADTGIGIRPADLLTLFQPFRQIDDGLSRSHEGTGLGLAICRSLTALMGGSIVAESAFGKGSTFRVTLPLEGPVKP